MRIRRAVSLVVGILAIVTVSAAFVILGTPWHERRIAIDLHTADELMTVAREQRQADCHPLPPKRRHDATFAGRIIDPAAYHYRRLNDTQFELCATFLERSDDEADPAAETLKHPAGRTCFRFDAADPTTPLGSTR
jgi:hypothetical protein